MGIKLQIFLDHIRSDGSFLVTISKNNKKMYFGYSDKIPDELKEQIISSIYLDFSTNSLYIHLN